MKTKKKELYLVDKYGKRAGVVLDIETYNKLRNLKALVDLSEILSSLKKILSRRPPDLKALQGILEDIEDIVVISERLDEEAIPWEKAKKELNIRSK